MNRPQAVGLRTVLLSLLLACLLPQAAPAAVPSRAEAPSTAEAGEVPPVAAPPRRPLVATPRRLRTRDALELARTAKQVVRAGTAGQACTGWRSTVLPPPTIRVLRTNSPVAGVNGTVQTVDFRTYVGIVIAAEWPGYYHPEVLKAGAIAVKQFAWYYTIAYRGGMSHAQCYDVQDSTNDQWFHPETRAPALSHLRAIRATWTMHLRKFRRQDDRGRFFLTGYRAGAHVGCGTDTDEWHLYQHSAFACARNGFNMEQILRTYLEPGLEIVAPGHHDILGTAAGVLDSEVGDISAMVEGPKGRLVPYVWKVGRSSIGQGQPAGITIGPEGLIGFVSEDVNGDGWDDLLVARQTGPTSVAVSVARSDGTGYLESAGGWTGDVGEDVSRARLVRGDFDGDHRADAGLLLRGAKSAHTLLVLRHRKGIALRAPVTWWTGEIDPASSQVHGGDVNGDGRTDLVVITDLGAAGRRYEVALSSAPYPGLDELRERLMASDLGGDGVRHAVGDVTRDGRDDVIALVDGPSRTRIEILKAPRGGGDLRRSVAWTSASGERLPFAKLRLTTADVDYDGLADLILHQDEGDQGTRVRTFRTAFRDGYGELSPGMSVEDPGIDWDALRPY